MPVLSLKLKKRYAELAEASWQNDTPMALPRCFGKLSMTILFVTGYTAAFSTL